MTYSVDRVTKTCFLSFLERYISKSWAWSRIMTFITFKEKLNTYVLSHSATDQTSPAVIWKNLEIKHVKWWPLVKRMVTCYNRCTSKTLHRCLNWEAVALIVFCLRLVYPLFRDFGLHLSFDKYVFLLSYNEISGEISAILQHSSGKNLEQRLFYSFHDNIYVINRAVLSDTFKAFQVSNLIFTRVNRYTVDAAILIYSVMKPYHARWDSEII